MSGGHEVTLIERARVARGWPKAEVCRRLFQARTARGMQPPSGASLKRMYIEWESGRVQVTDWQDEFCEVFELSASQLGFVDRSMPAGITLPVPVLDIVRLDDELIRLLDDQTDHYRLLDSKLGPAIIGQTRAHVDQISLLARNALPGRERLSIASTLAEAAALSGWQALDSGDPRTAWDLHETAKSAAREGEDVASLAHVTAQQAYSLLDAGRVDDAVVLVQYAASPDVLRKVPARLQAWLYMVHAEVQAARGDAKAVSGLLERAESSLPPGDSDPDLPYLVLNLGHLARWRGHCLARLGAAEAVADLQGALSAIEGDKWARIEASLRIDLAIALRARGEPTPSREQASMAQELAGRTSSQRQRNRIVELLN